MSSKKIGKVFFIGAGPGDPNLITVRGQQLIAAADVILYAGSLVSKEILQFASPTASVYNSISMSLDEQISLMTTAGNAGKNVARLHTGDPSIYGAIDEQMRRLKENGIPFEIIPGVTSAFAAAAALGIEYTAPDVTQTLILTRASGRTSVPDLEKLRSLAAHHCSLAIFLSVGLIQSVVEELIACGYAPDTAIAVVFRASWPDQLVINGTLSDICEKVADFELTHHGLIIVSPMLEQNTADHSYLYGGYQSAHQQRNGTAIIAITAPAAKLARKLLAELADAELFVPQKLLKETDSGNTKIHGFQEATRSVLQDSFQRFASLVCIMAAGIVVRELAPLLRSKHSDPAVVVMDPEGKHAISLLSGHEGGANALAQQLAQMTGGQAVITTASDHAGVPALDVLAKALGWKLDARSRFPQVMGALIDRQPAGFIRDATLKVPAELVTYAWAAESADWEDSVFEGCETLVALSYQKMPDRFWQKTQSAAVYYPPVLAVGIGCNRGTPVEEITDAIQTALTSFDLAFDSIAAIATISNKANEIGLIEACDRHGWPLLVFSRTEIAGIKTIPNPSAIVQEVLGVAGVAEPAALLAAASERLLVPKQKYQNVTVAVAIMRKEQ